MRAVLKKSSCSICRMIAICSDEDSDANIFPPAARARASRSASPARTSGSVFREERLAERAIDEVHGAGFLGAWRLRVRRKNLCRERAQGARLGGGEVRKHTITPGVVARARHEQRELQGEPPGGGGPRRVDQEGAPGKGIAMHHHQRGSVTVDRSAGGGNRGFNDSSRGHGYAR